MSTQSNPTAEDVAAFEMFKQGAADRFAERGVDPETADALFTESVKQAQAQAQPTREPDVTTKLASAVVAAKKARLAGK